MAVTSAGGVESLKCVDVAVVGNGPSAIALSFMLSGWTPYYAPSSEVESDDILHARLSRFASTPITDLDLESLCSGLEGRSSSPLGLLYDQLAHPAADWGSEEPPRLRWVYQPERAVSHVVLGSSLPGGSWHTMSKDMLTLSRCDWIELPNLPFREWYGDKEGGEGGASSVSGAAPSYRATAGDVARYYSDYVNKHGLQNNFISRCKVDCVRRVPARRPADAANATCSLCTQPGRPSHEWQLRGHSLSSGDAVLVAAKYLVLATGACDAAARLRAPGEDREYVRRSLKDLEAAVAGGSIGRASKPVLVVGSGISAAEAILTARRAEAPVVHVYRRSADDRGIVYGSLPPSLYPEYAELSALVSGQPDATYASHALSRIKEFCEGGAVVIERLADGEQTVVDVSLAVVLIGFNPDLSFMPGAGCGLGGRLEQPPVDGRRNPVAVHPFTYQCVRDQTLFAMGPLVGDNFVRFLQGAALGITKKLQEYARAPSPPRKSEAPRGVAACLSPMVEAK